MSSKFFKGFCAGMISCCLLTFIVFLVESAMKSKDNQIPAMPQEIDSTVNLNDIPDSELFKKKYENIVALIEKCYLNVDDIEAEEVVDGMYQGMLEALGDKYADYYTPEEYKEFQESYTGKYCGIGAMVMQNSKTGEMVITNPFEGAPAAKAGAKAGDIIVKIEDKSTAEMSLDDAVALMKGEEGTDVKVELNRDGKMINLVITREQVDVPTVSHEMIEETDIGYIYVSAFDEVTVKQFREALNDVNDKGAKGIIIDVRNNGGGRLDSVIEMLDMILADGMIMYTETRNGIDEEYVATGEESYDKPIAVLINEYSASASEVFAGCIQDRKKGTIVGTTSYGKGVVQSLYPLMGVADGSAIKITTSKYYTPLGRNIDGKGITPDVEVEYDEAKTEKVGEQYIDTQLKKAIEVIESK